MTATSAAIRVLFSAALTLGAALVFAPDAAAQEPEGVLDLLRDAAGPAGEGADEGSLGRRAIQLFLMVTVLSLAPGLAIMVTCFPFMVIVLSMLRQAIGLQQAPPNMMIVSLAIFLTYFVMEPVFTEAWISGVRPLIDGDVTEAQAFQRAAAPFRAFMENRASESALAALAEAAPTRTTAADGAPFSVLVPAFMLSEIERGFQVGFLIFLPFLVIDLVVASILMAMGMMMVPPTVVSLPFKLAFFVMAQGWTNLAGALVRGYAA